jgi:hypothetical protein
VYDQSPAGTSVKKPPAASALAPQLITAAVITAAVPIFPAFSKFQVFILIPPKNYLIVNS